MKRHKDRPAFCAALAVLAAFAVSSARAQRANENAVASADDAFGTRVGNESIGLYGAYDARGFSPANAGNVRLEGLFFDLQSDFSGRIVRGNSVRVGISAQSYAFPAPTGIAEFNLRLPGEKTIVSAVAQYGQYDGVSLEVDAQVPVSTQLGIGVGASAVRYEAEPGYKANEWQIGTVVRWRPNDNVEVLGFGSTWNACTGFQQPLIFTGGPFQPPPIKRRQFYGQYWTERDCTLQNFGSIGRFALGDGWTLRAGVFRSGIVHSSIFTDQFRNVQPNGEGDHIILRQPRQEFASYSGEVRLTKVFTEGARRHTFDTTFRGRDVQRAFGGADTRNFGRGFIGTRVELSEPVWIESPVTDDRTRQGTVGIAYDVLWAGVGGLAASVQKTFYNRLIRAPNQPERERDAGPLLYSITANAFITKDLAIYAGHTRGLEESGTAPQSTVNGGEPMPVTITRQMDAGLRFALTPRLRLVAGVFEVTKPYFNVNAANLFGPLGSVSHRGIEVSLAGEVLTEGLTVVAGAVLLQPRISGDPVDRGVIGKVAVGPRPRTLVFNLQYQPAAWKGFGIDVSANHYGPQVARSDNLLETKAFTQLNIGARYRFMVGSVSASIRTQVSNVFNAYAWTITGNTGNFQTRPPRRISTILAADF